MQYQLNLFFVYKYCSIPGPTEVIASAEHFFADPTATLEGVVQKVEEMGPSGLLYFGLVYTVAEILAIPAIPFDCFGWLSFWNGSGDLGRSGLGQYCGGRVLHYWKNFASKLCGGSP